MDEHQQSLMNSLERARHSLLTSVEGVDETLAATGGPVLGDWAIKDILAHLGRIKGHRVLVGLAMEDHNHRTNAEAKLRRKRCDAMVLNGPGNVGTDTAEVEILHAETGWCPPISGSKAHLAAVIVALVESLAGAARLVE